MPNPTPLIRPNPVRQKLRNGEAAFGTMAFEFFTPGLPYVLASAGAEFVIYDMEHSGVGIETIKTMIMASHGAGIVPLVRVPGPAYHLIAPVMDAGAFGVMVPMVGDATTAQAIADACRFRPDGIRGLAFGLGHDEFSGGDIDRKMIEENQRTLVIALIETLPGIENVDEILAVEGIDVGWLGHYDLTNAMGITGQFDHPDFLAAVDKLTAACARNGKAAGFLPQSPDSVDEWVARGFRCLAFGTDVGLLKVALGTGIEAMVTATANAKA